MHDMKAQRSIYDNAVFYWIIEDQLQGICACHVDDFILSGADLFMESLISGVKSRFKVSSECDGIFKYVGLQITHEESCICVSQNQYYNEIEQLNMNVSPNTALNEKQKRDYKSLAGQLNWISSHSRPDLSFDVCVANVSLKNATKREADHINKAVRKMKSQDVRLNFANVGDISECKWICYTDASFANLPGKASQGGYIIFLKGANGKYSPIAWKSKKIKRVVKSTMAAETLALLEGAEHAFGLKSFLQEITGYKKERFPIVMRTDNDSLEQSVNSTNSLEDKRLELDIAIIREMLEKKELAKVEWVSTAHQLADCLTKRGASSEKLLDALKGNWDM